MLPKSASGVIRDRTDPLGTLRPNLPAEEVGGSQFVPMICPQFEHRINLPADLKITPINIWFLFFSRMQIEIIVENTNANRRPIVAPQKKARIWKDTTVEEMYIWLGILIAMGLYPEPEIAQYWATQKKSELRFDEIREGMSKNRWEDISSALHLSNPGLGGDAFQKVS